MFRDESKAIVRKARIRESSEEQGVDSSASPSSPDTSTPQSLVNAAQIDAIDQKGTRFFFKQYIVHPGESNSTPPDTSLINVYAHAPLGVLLFDSAVAIGLAGLANINHDVNLMVCARRKYGNVIRGTSAALENVKPDTVQQLLYTAMLLTMFEVRLLHRPPVFRFG